MRGRPAIRSGAGSGLGHLTIRWIERLAVGNPCLEAALQVVGVPARQPEGRSRQRRAVSRATVEDHRMIPGDRLRLALQLVDLDVASADDPARVPFVGTPNVDRLGAAVDQLRRAGGLDPGLGRRVGGHSLSLVLCVGWLRVPTCGSYSLRFQTRNSKESPCPKQ